MAEYRHRTTGEVKSQGEWRKAHLNTSFPRVWTDATLDFLEIDPVFETPKPTPGKYETVRRNGVEKDAKGNWVQAWETVSMFKEYTDGDGVTHTVAEQQAEYQAGLDAAAGTSIRSKRDRLLAETDWVVTKAKETGTTLPAAWKTYRQALRDITAHDNFPHLNAEDWPAKPV